jgi:hypothetical protein
MARGKRIERIYAWICTEPDGTEGIPAVEGPSIGQVMPLVGADRERIESFRAEAVAVARGMGLPVRLVCFENLVELERLTDA